MNVIDFNELQQLTLVVRMADDDKTVIHISAPTLDLVEELKRKRARLEATMQQARTAEQSRAIYDLAARLISCNLDGITVTPEELAVKYRISETALGVFFIQYTEYLNRIKNEKN